MGEPLRVFFQDALTTLYHGDALEILPQLSLSGWFCFSAPPWNCGVDYGVYKDDLPKDVYLSRCEAWMKQVRRCDACGFFLPTRGLARWWVMLGDEYRQIILLRPVSETVLDEDHLSGFTNLLTNVRLRKARSDVWTVSTTSGDARSDPGPEATGRALDELGEGRPVLDPFCGSGNTLFEARRRRRPNIGIEIDGSLCAAIAKRCEEEQPCL